MDASEPADLVNMEFVHTQSRLADIIAGHVALTVAQATNAPAHKRQGNIVVQGGIPAGRVGREGTPCATASARSAGPPAGTMSKVSCVKRKKVPTNKPSPTPSALARHSPTVPFYDAASTAGEVFDERAGSGGSNNAAAEFVNLLATNAIDIDQAPIVASITMNWRVTWMTTVVKMRWRR
ncbi:hypothetical protein D1007_06512 [Hordeum vulgare]|nr:hypothetical protein D1007_06512 [Hordeum vulgare]